MGGRIKPKALVTGWILSSRVGHFWGFWFFKISQLSNGFLSLVENYVLTCGNIKSAMFRKNLVDKVILQRFDNFLKLI